MRALAALLAVVGVVFIGLAAISIQIQRVEGGLGTNGSTSAFESLNTGASILTQSVGLTALAGGFAAVFLVSLGVFFAAVGGGR